MASAGFNQKVWQALRLIPRGRVTTYKELARYLGKPKAARAVGNACGKNPDAPKTPCHRVVKSDGRLGGYSGRGGVKMKTKLLEKEKVKVVKGVVENFQKIIYKFKKR